MFLLAVVKRVSLRSTDLAALGLLAAATAAALVLWPRLPGSMAVRFDAGGTPDTYVSRPVGMVLAPVIGIAGVGITRLAERSDPSSDSRVVRATVLFVGGVVAYLQGLVLAYNLGHAVRLPFALAPAGIASVALVGYALVRDPP
ncbi:hypothetical protein BRC84_03165 [Halobacteriales archaeon QS_1_68_44]|nr:MAG: hypothetical protein BRC84_03165 [Halobacteriales archaeon QS_1_68_44]